jgi:TolA-binding protein
MRVTLNRNRWILAGIAASLLASGPVQAQKREDFIALQRDLANLQDEVKQLRKTQDDKLAALQALVQQSLDASSKVSGSISALQTSLTTTLAEQQNKVVAPVAALGLKVDQMGDEFSKVRESVADLGAQLRRLDTKLEDVSTAVRTLNTPPPPPAAAPGSPTATQVEQPPASAEVMFDNARRDFTAKRDELAMPEFIDYLKYYGTSENAHRAQFYIAQIYERHDQFEDAAKAYDAVLERYQPNPFTQEALYYKAVNLQKAKKRNEAIDTYQEFIREYPTNEHVAQARTNLRSLGVSSISPAKPAAKRVR